MKPLILLVLAAGLDAADLSGVQKVYLMSMGNGLDQHLADQLTRNGYTVVVDPKQANGIWTDRIDAAFVNSLNDLLPPPKPEKDKEKKDAAAEGTEKPPSRGIWSRTRGTIFLVDTHSRQVLWSTFLNLSDTSPLALHKAAGEIVKRLKKGE